MDQKTAFITGVSSGIGHGLAEEYLAQGWKVFGVSRRQPQIESDNFHFAALDLTDESNVASVLGQLLKETTHISHVVLNAGVLGKVADIADAPLEDLRRTMDINVWSCKTVLDSLFAMKIQCDQVVTISSGAAINGNRGWNGYSISKAALNMLTQLYAAENEKTHFAAVAPGLVDTAMQDYLCGLPEDPRYPSLENLKVRRGTAEMPSPAKVAGRLISVFQRLPDTCASGGFVDIRQLP